MTIISKLTNDGCVPKAEVNLGILNVGFGDLGNNGVTVSKTGYIRGRGPRGPKAHTRKYSQIYNFLANFQADKLAI